MKLLDRESYLPILESFLIGTIAGLSAVLLMSGVAWLGTLRVHLSDMLPGLPVLAGFGLVGGLIAGLLVEKVAPEAAGSGIPQVRARLERIVMALDLRVAFVKLIGGTFALGSGLFMGREGPTVQLGAALAAPLSRLFPSGVDHRRQMIAAGAGAGLTAAFNAPLAGVTFILEELLKETRPSTIAISITACGAACLIVNTLNPPHLRQAVHDVSTGISFTPADLPFYVILGVMAGVVSAIFNRAILGALRFNRDVLKLPLSIRVGLAGLVSGAIIAALPEAFHNYAGMRAAIITGEQPVHLVLIAFIEYYFLTLVAYGSGAPGGLFAPSLALGSALGCLVGILNKMVLGAGSPSAFALVGMGAFFAGVARTPLTAIVITFELTTSFDLLVPLMLTCVLSSAVGEIFYRGGLYEHLMRWNGIYLRGPNAEENFLKTKAKDVMQTTFESLEVQSLVEEALDMLNTSSQRGFPVTDKGKLVGVVSQTDMSRLHSLTSLERLSVKALMTPHPVAVRPHDTLEEILFLFSQYKFSWLPVTENDKLKGIIKQSDVLQALFAHEENVVLAKESAKEPDNASAQQSEVHK